MDMPLGADDLPVAPAAESRSDQRLWSPAAPASGPLAPGSLVAPASIERFLPVVLVVVPVSNTLLRLPASPCPMGLLVPGKSSKSGMQVGLFAHLMKQSPNVVQTNLKLTR